MSDLTRPVIAANWKMHLGPSATRAYLRAFASSYGPRDDRTVVFFPPALSLPAFLDARGQREDLEAGVQDVHEEEEGAHTGSVSASMAADAGATWGLAGHSERRHEFGDDPEQVARKVERLLDAGLRPVLCVGETIEERRAGRLEAVLRRQAGAVLDVLPAATARRLVYAYEPVWAIGTGETAEPGDAREAHAFLREVIADRVGDEAASGAVVMYGGSVKPHNADEILSTPEIDGVLVGSASLEPDSFARICTAV